MKSKSFEAEVIEIATDEDEFTSQILGIAKLRFEGILNDKQTLAALDAIHESAHVSLEQRSSERDHDGLGYSNEDQESA